MGVWLKIDYNFQYLKMQTNNFFLSSRSRPLILNRLFIALSEVKSQLELNFTPKLNTESYTSSFSNDADKNMPVIILRM